MSKNVFHKPADSYELKTSASKNWVGWKTVKDDSMLA
jgi:hypothetical protein